MKKTLLLKKQSLLCCFLIKYVQGFACSCHLSSFNVLQEQCSVLCTLFDVQLE